MTETDQQQGHDMTGQPVPFTETPEFQEAVRKAASEAAVKAIEEMAKHGAPAGTGINGDATALFQQMAMAIAEISDQGSNRKRVAPEVLAQRAAAQKRAGDLIMLARDKVKEAREIGDRALEKDWLPEYKVLGKIYFNERFIEPFRSLADKTVVHNEIVWTGMPNDNLHPINDIAKKIYKEYRTSVGKAERIQSADNRPVWITNGGLVVKGDPPKRATVAPVTDFADDLMVGGAVNPTAEFVHVLGTVADPARQNVAGHEHVRNVA